MDGPKSPSQSVRKSLSVRSAQASDEPGKQCTTAETPVAVSGGAGSVLVIEKPLDHDSIAYLADSTTTVMHFQPGEASS